MFSHPHTCAQVVPGEYRCDVERLVSQGKEIFVEARIACQFGVKGCSEEMSLLRGNNPPVGNRSEYLRVAADRFNDRRTDENRVIIILRAGGLFEFGNVEIRFKGIDLSTKGIALDLDIHQPEQRLVAADILRKKDRARARAPDGVTLTELLQRLHQIVRHCQFADRRRFPAGDDETIEPVELFRQTHFRCFDI